MFSAELNKTKPNERARVIKHWEVYLKDKIPNENLEEDFSYHPSRMGVYRLL
jgi:hypothetical protein